MEVKQDPGDLKKNYIPKIVCFVFLFFFIHSIIVFGFNQTEFIGSERLQSYAVAIGFLSGSASQEVKGSIELTPVTASKCMASK